MQLVTLELLSCMVRFPWHFLRRRLLIARARSLDPHSQLAWRLDQRVGARLYRRGQVNDPAKRVLAVFEMARAMRGACGSGSLEAEEVEP